MRRLAPILRGAARRCPVCGSGGIFNGWMTLRESCPGCGFRFEREEGYWVGAMIVNLGVAQAAFFAFFILGMLVSWPEPPWTFLMIGGVAVMALLPVAFYPLSKSIWIGIDLLLHPLAE